MWRLAYQLKNNTNYKIKLQQQLLQLSINHQNGFNNNYLQVINTLTILQDVFIVVAVIILSALAIFGGVVVYQMKDESLLKFLFLNSNVI